MQGFSRRSASAALAAAAVLCVLASCSPSATPTQTTPPAPSAAATTAAATTAAATSATPAAGCAEVTELKASVEALTKVKPAEDGVPALKAALADVKTDLEAAHGSAAEVLQPSVEQVKTALTELSATLTQRCTGS